MSGGLLQADRVCSAAFVTTQAVTEKYGPDRVNREVRAVEAMERFLAKGPVKAELKGTAVAV